MGVCEEPIIEKTMSRIIKNASWLDVYLKYVDNTESPTSYHVWTALSCIAGALQRKCYIKWGLETVYPNMYVVLVGSAGRTRKSLAINIGQDVFKELDLITVSEAITPQALITKMANATTTYIDPQGIVRPHSSVTCFSKELSTLLGANQNFQYLAYMTDFWDSHDSWTYETIKRSEDPIIGMCLNILAASAPDWMSSMLPVQAIGGGFTSRCIFVVETNKSKHIALPTVSKDEEKLKRALIHDLKLIALYQGEYSFTKEAAETYKKWYLDQSTSMDSGEYPIDDPNFRAYCERRSTHLRKMCMALQAAQGDSKKITVETWNQAVTILTNTEVQMTDVFGGLGRSDQGQLIYEMLQYVGKKGKVNRDSMYKSFYKHCNWREFNEALDGMRASGLVGYNIETKTITFNG